MSQTPVAPLRVALVGNPNCGKTALFNLLTGARQKVANYAGVTVERKEGRFATPSGRRVRLLDLPGAYSLESTSPDERVTHDVLRGRYPGEAAPDLIVCVADATNLEPVPRQRLLEMARELGRPAVAIVLDVPPDVARARNLARARTVPPHVLDLHYERFRAARDVLATEGFTAIHEVQPGCAVRIVRIDGSP